MIRLSSIEKLIAAFILFIAVMLILRVGYANNIHYVFLLWNLFLAWVPFQVSVLLAAAKRHRTWYRYFLLAAWLLFFPNALYIVTDLIHLEEQHDNVPVWFDAILIFTAVVAGLIMAYASLFQAERFLKKHISSRHAGKLAITAIFLGSFGVYIGRFLRWNSWDILADPVALLREATANIFLPFHHCRAWVVTLLLTCLFSLLYFTIKKLPGLLQQAGN
jgi:uncharacterized membrane protein